MLIGPLEDGLNSSARGDVLVLWDRSDIVS